MPICHVKQRSAVTVTFPSIDERKLCHILLTESRCLQCEEMYGADGKCGRRTVFSSGGQSDLHKPCHWLLLAGITNGVRTSQPIMLKKKTT